MCRRMASFKEYLVGVHGSAIWLHSAVAAVSQCKTNLGYKEHRPSQPHEQLQKNIR